MTTQCSRPGCAGRIEDGYCVECGKAPRSETTPSAARHGVRERAAQAPAAVGVPALAGAQGTPAVAGSVPSIRQDPDGAAGGGHPVAGLDVPGESATQGGLSGGRSPGGRDGGNRDGGNRDGGGGDSLGADGGVGWQVDWGSGGIRLADFEGALVTTGGSITTGGSVVAGLGSVPTHARGRGRLWGGLVWVPTVPYQEPKVMSHPEVPEAERRCAACGGEVGRSREDRPARETGFCAACRAPYSFAPTLKAGDLVAGQYEIQGCLTRGGLGWLYLARDHNLDHKAVVLKGLLNTGDADAQEAAIAERGFLIEIEHPAVVRILNFVRHPHPSTGEGVGYIVMEYVGGLSLDQAPANRPDALLPHGLLPLDQAMAYMLDALAILADLHDRGLLYCDFKEKNVMQVGDQLKLIDLGAATAVEPVAGSLVWGTKGYEAPEIELHGPSVSSDLYTVARTLARLTVDVEGFRAPRGFATTYRERLPSPAEAPLLAEVDSYHRLLLRATHPDPDCRFTSAAEMAEQVEGVLREVVAAAEGTPRPSASRLFTQEVRAVGTLRRDTTVPVGDIPVDDGTSSGPRRRRNRRADAGPLGHSAVSLLSAVRSQRWSGTARLLPEAAAGALPVPQVDLSDPGAAYLATLDAAEPALLVAALDAAPVQSVEIRLRRVRALIAAREFYGLDDDLGAIADADPRDWRVQWFRGVAALMEGRPDEAQAAFDAVYSHLPGELAPKLAVAMSAECVGDTQVAVALYDVVWRTNRSYISAGFGLARTLLSLGDRRAAVVVLESVPHTSSYHLAAREAAIRCRVEGRAAAESIGPELREASMRLDELDLEEERCERLEAEILEATLAWVLAGRAGGAPDGMIRGCPADEREVRAGLEHVYRSLARRTADLNARVALVDRANQVRPWQLF